ncbi:hypothetical protein F4678DRAFT_451845 [Xylaria arbuscula]|nr:hypothetical protein F4678DRAFT_451845 [Xylaria arbuscula]
MFETPCLILILLVRGTKILSYLSCGIDSCGICVSQRSDTIECFIHPTTLLYSYPWGTVSRRISIFVIPPTGKILQAGSWHAMYTRSARERNLCLNC